MAIVVDIITEFSDKGLTTAKGAFNDFKTRVGAAEGAMGKFKAGSNAAMDAVKANAANFALAGGAAFATFAAKGVTAFKDLALEADKFASATGLAVEDASRWLEVSGDLGVNADSIQTAIGKMNKELADNPFLLKRLGDDIVYANDGSLDANETFLNLIDRLKNIKDPAQRAAEGAKIFGRGWQDMSVLIETGSGKLRTALGAVSDAKVIDPKEVEKAKKLRDSLDDLKDIGENLALSIGQNLLPMLERLAELLKLISENTRGMGGVMEMTTQQMADAGIETAKLQLAHEANLDAMKGYYESRVNAYLADTADIAQDTATEIDNMKIAFQELRDEINNDISMRNLETQLGDIKEAALQALSGSREDVIKYMDAVDKAKISVLDLGEAIDLQSQKTLTLYVDDSDIQGALGYLKAIEAMGTGLRGERVNQFGRLTSGTEATIPIGTSAAAVTGAPEIISQMVGTGRTGAVMSNSITVNVNGGDPNEIVRAIQNWTRQNGAVPLATTTAIRR